MTDAGSKCNVSKRLLSILAIALVASPVRANFFARMVMSSDANKDSKGAGPPSGATVARGSNAQVGNVISNENGILMANLLNNNKIPLVGIGVGNAPLHLVSPLVSEALQNDKRIRLIDTSHSPGNEETVAHGILRGVEDMWSKQVGKKKKIPVHVLTKVWYTHLGYERTKIALEKTMVAFKDVMESNQIDLKLHVVLHWPRCDDTVPWMECEDEERELSEFIRTAGPDPSSDHDAWKESWRVLEDMYLSENYPIESIGVSNFHMKDLEQMDRVARIHPHILQMNVWSLLYSSELVDYCHKHRIHVQVFNAMSGTMAHPDNAPNAFHHIQKVAFELTEEQSLSSNEITPAQVVLAWLVQHGVSVIPRTSKLSRLEENSAIALQNIPGMNDRQVETVAHAVEALLGQDDFEEDIHVSVSFHAVNKDIMLFWHADDGTEVRIAHVKQGEVFDEVTFPNHVFRTYDASNKDVFAEHKIEANFGDHRNIHVEL